MSSLAQGHASCRRSEATGVDLGGTLSHRLSHHNFYSKASPIPDYPEQRALVGLVSPPRFLCHITRTE